MAASQTEVSWSRMAQHFTPGMNMNEPSTSIYDIFQLRSRNPWPLYWDLLISEAKKHCFFSVEGWDFCWHETTKQSVWQKKIDRLRVRPSNHPPIGSNFLKKNGSDVSPWSGRHKKNHYEPSGSTFGPAVSRGSFGLYLKIHCMAWTVVKVLGIWRPQIDIPSGKLTPIAMENSPF